MPRKRIPEDELFRRKPKMGQSAPDNRGCGFGKAISAFLRLAGAPRMNVAKKLFCFDSDVFISPQKDSLGGHGNSREMAAAVTERFANDSKPRLAEPITKVSAQLFAPNPWRSQANVVFFIDLPPRIEDRAGGRLLELLEKLCNRIGKHSLGLLLQTIVGQAHRLPNLAHARPAGGHLRQGHGAPGSALLNCFVLT